MRIMVWHVHGGWMNGFLRGTHEYLIPRSPDETDSPVLPDNAHLISESQLHDEHIDLIVLQRLEELDETQRLLGCIPGRDLPAVFVEHNTPQPHAVDQRHPLADQSRIPIVHVTHFNRLMWDNGDAPTHVIEHGIPDPGHLYTGEIPALGVVINEPVRRGRAMGTDLLPHFAEVGRLDAFGIDSQLLPAALNLPPNRLRIVGNFGPTELHAELARRRAYLHTTRWTSLGLSLLEAMSLGMPVLVLATTEAYRAVPPEAGAISADPQELRAAARALLDDPDEARRRGTAAREFVRERYGLTRFLHDWDALLEERVEARVTV